MYSTRLKQPLALSDLTASVRFVRGLGGGLTPTLIEDDPTLVTENFCLGVVKGKRREGEGKDPTTAFWTNRTWLTAKPYSAQTC